MSNACGWAFGWEGPFRTLTGRAGAPEISTRVIRRQLLKALAVARAEFHRNGASAGNLRKMK
jgi:hypothetical protein